jgi:hypothetical protein
LNTIQIFHKGISASRRYLPAFLNTKHKQTHHHIEIRRDIIDGNHIIPHISDGGMDSYCIHVAAWILSVEIFSQSLISSSHDKISSPVIFLL